MQPHPSRAGASAFLVSACVGLTHLLMWPYGYLEEWGLIRVWQSEGVGAVLSGLSTTAGRPLHLVPAHLGLGLSGGRLLGMYLVTALITGATFVAVRWALRPLSLSTGLATAGALALAMHPFWSAGWLLRFQPAQAAVLGLVLWLGLALRVLASGGRVRGALSALALAAGLLTYQAVALVPMAVLAVLWALSVMTTGRLAPPRRLLTLCAVTAGTVMTVATWTLLLAPRLAPNSYEAGLQGGGGLQIASSSRTIYATVLSGLAGPVLMVLAMTVVMAAAVRAMRAGETRAQTARLTGTALTAAVVLTAPLTSLTYATTTLHLRDPERVLLPATTTLIIVVLAVAPHVRVRPLPRSLAAALIAALVVPALLALVGWRGLGERNYELLAAVLVYAKDAPPGTSFVVSDRDGYYGDVYTWLPPSLSTAASAAAGRPVDVTLCTDDDVVRDHPVAARYPIDSTPACAAILGGKVVASRIPLAVTGRDAELFIITE